MANWVTFYCPNGLHTIQKVDRKESFIVFNQTIRFFASSTRNENRVYSKDSVVYFVWFESNHASIMLFGSHTHTIKFAICNQNFLRESWSSHQIIYLVLWNDIKSHRHLWRSKKQYKVFIFSKLVRGDVVWRKIKYITQK